MNPKLLFITCHKFCDNNGGVNGSKGFAHCFSRLFDDCSIIYPEFGGDPHPFFPQNFKLYPCHDNRGKPLKALDMYRGVLSPLYYAVRKHLKSHKYDIIVVDHSVTGTSIIKAIKATGAKVITIHHNVERDYLRDNIKEWPIVIRYAYHHYAKKSEHDCLKNSDINLTVTERDASQFRSWYSNQDIHVYNWGNFEFRTLEDKLFPSKGKEKTFVITGSLEFYQSLLPIMEFLERYWPLIKKEYKDANLKIAGRNPHQKLIEACTKENIQIFPNPTDMSAIVQQANYYICPIYAGSGRKLRIIDAFKQGLPVLCHDVSMSGYEDMASSNCLFPYHNEETFVTSLHMMLSTDISKEEVYQTFRKNFSIEAGTRKLESILKSEGVI